MVTIRNLQKSYGIFQVLNGLDMDVADGEIYGFLGKNGCGKTTTMNILCNVIPKDGGDILLGNGGEKVKIGYLPETPSLFSYMNGYEYLRYIAACCNYHGNVESRVGEILETVGMVEGAKRRIKGYSRGMNQRLGIAAVMFDHPQLLVLDEPTSALDPEGRADVMNIITRLSETGCTIILCTHILSDVEKCAGSIGIMSGGRMAAQGKISDIMNEYSRNEVEIKLYENDENSVNALRSLEALPVVDKVDYYDKTGIFVVRSTDTRTASGEITKLLAEKGITPYYMKTVTESLEQIYLKVVNGNA